MYLDEIEGSRVNPILNALKLAFQIANIPEIFDKVSTLVLHQENDQLESSVDITVDLNGHETHSITWKIQREGEIMLNVKKEKCLWADVDHESFNVKKSANFVWNLLKGKLIHMDEDNELLFETITLELYGSDEDNDHITFLKLNLPYV